MMDLRNAKKVREKVEEIKKKRTKNEKKSQKIIKTSKKNTKKVKAFRKLLWKIIAIEYSIFTFFILASSYKYILNINAEKEKRIQKQEQVISVLYKQYVAEVNRVNFKEIKEVVKQYNNSRNF